MLVSSANKIDFNVVDTLLHMSFIYSINKAGPRIEPCGTSHDTFNCSELVSLIHVYTLAYILHVATHPFIGYTSY